MPTLVISIQPGEQEQVWHAFSVFTYINNITYHYFTKISLYNSLIWLHLVFNLHHQKSFHLNYHLSRVLVLPVVVAKSSY